MKNSKKGYNKMPTGKIMKGKKYNSKKK